MSESGDNLPPSHLSPRLCHLEKWPHFNGYGFNLHAERGKSGQFIGKVDDDSPSQKADLRQGDRIVEINKVNVLNQNHHQVVTLIRESGDQVELLVADSGTMEHYRQHNMVITGEAPNIIFGDGKWTGDNNNDAVNVDEEHIEQVEAAVDVMCTPEVPLPEPEPEQDYDDEAVPTTETPSPPPVLEPMDEPDAAPVEEFIVTQRTTIVHAEPEPEPESEIPEPKPETPEPKPETPEPEPETPEPKPETPEPEPETPEPKPATPEPKLPQNGDAKSTLPSFQMTAKEYREMMTKKREKDARNKAMGFKAKKDAFERL